MFLHNMEDWYTEQRIQEQVPEEPQMSKSNNLTEQWNPEDEGCEEDMKHESNDRVDK